MTVLGALLQDPDLLPACRRVLSPDDFYHHAHQLIFASAVRLAEKGEEPVTWMAITRELRQRGHLEEIGGNDYLCSLIEAVPTTAIAPFHLRVVAGKAQARRIAALALSLWELAMADTGWQSALKDIADVAPLVLQAEGTTHSHRRRFVTATA
jgi:replicative DNA helicase